MADNPKSKEPRGGFTVSELEDKFKKYGLEICLCAMFILSAIFALIWGGMMLSWSILLTMILGIVGILLPKQIQKVHKATFDFIYKEKVTAIAAAVIGILLSILIPPLVFAFTGLVAGKSLGCECSDSCDN